MKYCLIGEKLTHSFSAILHGSLGADYSLVEVKDGDLERFVKDSDYDGYNVTIPYKKSVIPFLDGVSALAKRLGAVNTVKCENGKKTGYNTDYYGFLQTLKEEGVSPEGKIALVLGTGGAANTAVAALYDAGAKQVFTVSRTGEINYRNCYDLKNVKIIVNATPVGTAPDYDFAPIDLERFKGVEFVFDLVYNPFCTALLKKAQELNIACANGAKMLVYQALYARQIWTGEKITESAARRCFAAIKEQTVNIALVGMPSSGKTTVGKIISEKLCKKFVDTDAVVSDICGKTPAELISAGKESEFRAIESQALKIAVSTCGSIVATGGGAILSPLNRRLLKQTSFVVYLKRDLEKLETTGRPISKARGVYDIYSERAPLYESVADITVSNDGDAEVAAERIISAYENFGY